MLTLLFVHVMINPQTLYDIFNSEIYDTMWCAKNFSVMFPETLFIHILKFCCSFRVGYCQMTFYCSVE